MSWCKQQFPPWQSHWHELITRTGPAGHSGRRSRPRGSLPRSTPETDQFDHILVTKCTVKHVSNQSVPSEQLKHALNARKQSKTSAKRAKTVHLTRKMAKARQPIALSLETLSNQSMTSPNPVRLVDSRVYRRSILNHTTEIRFLCSIHSISSALYTHTTRIQDNWTAKTWFHKSQ